MPLTGRKIQQNQPDKALAVAAVAETNPGQFSFGLVGLDADFDVPDIVFGNTIIDIGEMTVNFAVCNGIAVRLLRQDAGYAGLIYQMLAHKQSI